MTTSLHAIAAGIRGVLPGALLAALVACAADDTRAPGTFVTRLVMKLVEQGVLDLERPLQRYAREPLWQNRSTTPSAWHEDLSALRGDPRLNRITARMSMSHTTGLPGWRWFEPVRSSTSTSSRVNASATPARG